MAFSIPTVANAWRYPPGEPSSWDGYHSLELRDVQVHAPGKGEVLVKIRAVTLNSRVIIQVVYYEVAEYLPTILGSRVQGCLSQYRIFPAKFILPIPDHLSYEEGASTACAGITAFNALFDSGELTPDSTVLVLGSGGVSVLGAQFAKAAGARVIATTSSQEKAQKYKELGVSHVINYRETPNWAEEVKKVTDGQGVDQVLETSGQGTLMEAIRSLKAKGVVHLIGGSTEEAPTTAYRDLTLGLMSSGGKLNGVTPGGKDVAQRLDSFMTQHKLKPLLDSRVFAWEEADKAFEYLERGAHFGKVVIRVD
ncbi:Zinc-binding dehydrogenase [Rhizoctonia solani]|uniref:Zinc-binding dehydrogenase n=1 Tax=Rhizoctonia solani TaxID=456999 RepID=A0A8H8SXW7_9AGAM|nr:Zinc-binding dehydrogenase [Rhizoctonia solani]QRW22571.1 Zinc-binding dehydrogenase [Rhizoctonia solani]